MEDRNEDRNGLDDKESNRAPSLSDVLLAILLSSCCLIPLVLARLLSPIGSFAEWMSNRTASLHYPSWVPGATLLALLVLVAILFTWRAIYSARTDRDPSERSADRPRIEPEPGTTRASEDIGESKRY